MFFLRRSEISSLVFCSSQPGEGRETLEIGDNSDDFLTCCSLGRLISLPKFEKFASQWRSFCGFLWQFCWSPTPPSAGGRFGRAGELVGTSGTRRTFTEASEATEVRTYGSSRNSTTLSR